MLQNLSMGWRSHRLFVAGSPLLQAWSACCCVSTVLMIVCLMQGVCHRDLKLENTLLDGRPAPRLKICDFGYSKVQCLLLALMSSQLATLIPPHHAQPSFVARPVLPCPSLGFALAFSMVAVSQHYYSSTQTTHMSTNFCSVFCLWHV